MAVVLTSGVTVTVTAPLLPAVTTTPPPPVVVVRDVTPPVPSVRTPGLPAASVTVLPVPGPPGPRGASGDVYTHTQTLAAAVWTVRHALGRQLVAAAVWSADLAVQWDGVTVQPIDADTCRLSFEDPTAGVALIT